MDAVTDENLSYSDIVLSIVTENIFFILVYCACVAGINFDNVVCMSQNVKNLDYICNFQNSGRAISLVFLPLFD
jgi:hypothetical protein